MNTRLTRSQEMYKIAEWMVKQEYSTVKTEFNFMDVFGFNFSGDKDSVEIEIKVNDYDFHKEFTKPCKKAKHKAYRYHAGKPLGFCPTRFYFFVPIALGEVALKRIRKHYPHYGLIVWDSKNIQETVIRKARRMHEKPYMGERLCHPFEKYLQNYRKMERERNYEIDRRVRGLYA